MTLTPRVRAFHLVLGAIIPNAISIVVVTLGIWWWATQSSVTLLVHATQGLANLTLLTWRRHLAGWFPALPASLAATYTTRT